MSYKRVNNHRYIADTAEDLRSIRGESIGARCYVIKEGCDYALMSSGEWVKQPKESAYEEGGNFATEEYVDAKIEDKASQNYVDGKIEGVLDNPIFAMMNGPYNTTESYGIRIGDDSTTLLKEMEAKGVGVYNIWVSKTNSDLPEQVKAKNSSVRGLCSVGTVNAQTKEWHGWILIFDQDGEIYSRYIRKSAATNWKHLVTE